jgi:hypothetical protein
MIFWLSGVAASLYKGLYRQGRPMFKKLYAYLEPSVVPLLGECPIPHWQGLA